MHRHPPRRRSPHRPPHPRPTNRPLRRHNRRRPTSHRPTSRLLRRHNRRPTSHRPTSRPLRRRNRLQPHNLPLRLHSHHHPPHRHTRRGSSLLRHSRSPVPHRQRPPASTADRSSSRRRTASTASPAGRRRDSHCCLRSLRLRDHRYFRCSASRRCCSSWPTDWVHPAAARSPPRSPSCRPSSAAAPRGWGPIAAECWASPRRRSGSSASRTGSRRRDRAPASAPGCC